MELMDVYGIDVNYSHPDSGFRNLPSDTNIQKYLYKETRNELSINNSHIKFEHVFINRPCLSGTLFKSFLYYFRSYLLPRRQINTLISLSHYFKMLCPKQLRLVIQYEKKGETTRK